MGFGLWVKIWVTGKGYDNGYASRAKINGSDCEVGNENGLMGIDKNQGNEKHYYH